VNELLGYGSRRGGGGRKSLATVFFGHRLVGGRSLLLPAKKPSPGCVRGVNNIDTRICTHGELTADWARDRSSLTHYNDRMTRVLEDPGGARRSNRLLGRTAGRLAFLSIASLSRGALRQIPERA